MFELDQCPWATPWSPFLAQTDFAKPQWFHLNMRLSRLPIDEFRKAVSWLSHLKCLDTARKEAVASAGRWLDIATYAHVQVASAALMLCDNADAARAMVSPHCLGKMLRDCLGAANRDQWSRIEQEATRTTPGCGEPLVQCLLETLVLDLMMDWQKLPPNSDVARNLWEWDVNLASHAAIADIFAKEAAKGDLANFNRWRECWAAADNGRREAMERLAARHVWERHKKEPIVETKLLETLWCTGILKEQPIWALDWWKEHCMKLLTAEPVSAKALVDLVKNTGTDLRQSLLNQLRFCHPEGTLKLQSGLERFGTHCLDEEQRKRWEILDKSLAKHHLRGPIMEDVLLGLK